MIKISYDIPGINNSKELNIPTVLEVTWKQRGRLISPVTMLVSIKNIGPCFGLYISPDGGEKVPLRIAGTFNAIWKPENPSILLFHQEGVEYRISINFFDIKKYGVIYQCDFVVTGLRPHNDPASVFIPMGAANDIINLESFKEILSLDLTIQEEAVFTAEGGFELRETTPKKKKRRAKIDFVTERLNNPVRVFNFIYQAMVNTHHRPVMPDSTKVREVFLKVWDKVISQDR